MDVFLENFRRGGGGSFSVQKITLQILLVSKRYILVVNFGKNVQKKRNEISKNQEGRGGSKAVWTFSKKTSKFGDTVVPKIAVNSCDWGCFYNPCHVWQHSFNIPSSDIFFCWEMEEEVKAILHFQLGWTWMMAWSQTVNHWFQRKISPKLWQRLKCNMIKYV